MDRILLAYRYLRARPITIISLLGVLVGVAALTVVDSVMNGFLLQQKAILRGSTADVVIVLPERMRSHPAELEALRDTVQATAGVRGQALRETVPCVYRIEGRQQVDLGVEGAGEWCFLQVVGIDRVEEESVSELSRYLTREFAFDAMGGAERFPAARGGDPFWYDPEHPFWQRRIPEEELYYPHTPLLVGEFLATQLRLSVGDVLSLATFSDPDEEGRYRPRKLSFLITGTFRTPDIEFDIVHAIVRRPDLLKFTGSRREAGEMVVSTEPGADEAVVRDALRAGLASRGVEPGSIQTWADKKARLLGAVENERRALIIVLFLMVVVACFNLLLTLHIMVSQKTRDIGILTAMGSTPLRAASVFLLCGVLVSVVGSLLGMIVGLLLTRNINEILGMLGIRMFRQDVYLFQSVPTEVDFQRIALFVGLTLSCSILFSLLPSLRAARLDPVEALRHG